MPEGKKRIAEIDVELTKQTMRFSENVLDSTNQYEWVITDESNWRDFPKAPCHGAGQRGIQRVGGACLALHAASPQLPGGDDLSG